MFVVLLCSAALALVNINTAGREELAALPGIAETKADAIVRFRTEHGPFAAVEDLDAVPGIGPSTLLSIRELVTVGSRAPVGDKKPGAAVPCTPVDINTADPTTLTRLPGINPSRAASIVSWRKRHGRFRSCADLDEVPGIGPATIAGLETCCTSS